MKIAKIHKNHEKTFILILRAHDLAQMYYICAYKIQNKITVQSFYFNKN